MRATNSGRLGLLLPRSAAERGRTFLRHVNAHSRLASSAESVVTTLSVCAACARERPRVLRRANPQSCFWASTASALCVSQTSAGAFVLLWCSLLFAVGTR